MVGNVYYISSFPIYCNDNDNDNVSNSSDDKSDLYEYELNIHNRKEGKTINKKKAKKRKYLDKLKYRARKIKCLAELLNTVQIVI